MARGEAATGAAWRGVAWRGAGHDAWADAEVKTRGFVGAARLESRDSIDSVDSLDSMNSTDSCEY